MATNEEESVEGMVGCESVVVTPSETEPQRPFWLLVLEVGRPVEDFIVIGISREMGR
jgi:hypothetical protein